MTTALSLLNTLFGHREFRGPQADIIAAVVAGEDALVLMPTGGGKSLCYQIPALMRPGLTVVVSPLIALMQDQVDALLALGIKAAFLNSSLDGGKAASVERAFMAGQVKLLYVAPERVVLERFLGQLDTLYEAKQLGLFAIDEAHCVSQWGHDFRADYLALSLLVERYPSVPRIALTATADALTRQEIRLRLQLNEAKEYIASFDRPNIHYRIIERGEERPQLLEFLGEHEEEAGIIYCLSRSRVDDLADYLQERGIPALPYHAGMSQEDRRRNQGKFLREEGVVMVATIAFGMGIDKPDVRFVVHLDLPKSVEGYYQETGRAGRDGEPAEALMIYGLKDVVQQARFIEQGDGSEDFKRASCSKLDALLGLCETSTCRRSRLLAYFGEETPLNYQCGNCDNCQSPPKTWDASEPVRMALSAIYRTGQRYGVVYVMAVLMGKKIAQITARGHESLSVYGIGKDLDEDAWRSLFRQLITLGLVEVDVVNYGVLRLTEAARPVLKGEVPAFLRQQVTLKKPVKEAKKAKEKLALELSENELKLFNSLKGWRSRTATAANVPSFVILHDSTLKQIAKQMPRDAVDLMAISGIGANKLAKYGEEILAVVNGFEDD